MAPRRKRSTSPLMAASVIGGLASLMLATGPAQAAENTATARVNRDEDGLLTEFMYNGGPARNDLDVTVVETGDFLWFVYLLDDVVPIKAGTNCTHPESDDRTLVTCVVPRATPGGYYVSTQINLGGGDDKLTLTDPLPENKLVDLGEGNDTYVTTLPAAYDAYLQAGDGNDTLTVGTAAEVFAGAGNDKITLVGRGAQNINAGEGNDVIKGSKGNDGLRGEAGNDIIYGNGGNDGVAGNTGNDKVYGGPGDDSLQGNSGTDVIYGNGGDDRISGGPGRDRLFGGPGKSTVIN